MKKKIDQKKIVYILISIIAILLLILIYFFVVKPSVKTSTINKQTEGFQYAILSIMQQVATCQPIPLTYNNQTINVIALECLNQNEETS